VKSVIADTSTKAMKLWRPNRSGPRKRAAAIETASSESCGTNVPATFQTPPRRTEAPVVARAARSLISGPPG
jgi:hypothetical protein